VLDSGKPLNAATIGEAMHISRSAVWALRKRHPWLEAWVNEQLEAANNNIVQAVIRKMGAVALRGSVDHAKVFLQAKGRLQSETPQGGPGGGVVAFQVNINGIPTQAPLEGWPGGVLPEAKR
jgi:hypothetical protein